MLRFYLRFVLTLLFVLAAALLVIHAQPYDDHELRELLLPEGCPAPCFMSIQPGVTTMDEAMKILKANSWVGQIEKASVFFDDDIIDWTWSDKKPKTISPSSHGQLWATQKSNKPLVNILTIYSYLPLGNILYALGTPDEQTISPAENTLDRVYYYVAFYEKGELSLQSQQSCNTLDPFVALVDIRIGSHLISPYSRPIHSAREALDC